MTDTPNETAISQAPDCDVVIWILDREFVGLGNASRCRTCWATDRDPCPYKYITNDLPEPNGPQTHCTPSQ